MKLTRKCLARRPRSKDKYSCTCYIVFSLLRNRELPLDSGYHCLRPIFGLTITPGGYPDDDPEKNTKEQRAHQNQAEIVHRIAAGIDAALRQRAEEASILIT